MILLQKTEKLSKEERNDGESNTEKNYLALSIEKAGKLVPPTPAQPIQTQTAQPPRRRGPHL